MLDHVQDMAFYPAKILPTFLCVLLFLSAASALEGSDPQEVTARPGEDVTLQCRAPSGYVIELLVWSRTDLKAEDGYVFFRNEGPQENYQHPSFRGRVKLRDPEMKERDVSVTLTNVSINDTGTYECKVGVGNDTARPKRNDPEPLSSVHLNVTHSDDTAGNNKNALVIGLSVGLGLAVVIGGVIFWGKRYCCLNERKTFDTVGMEEI